MNQQNPNYFQKPLNPEIGPNERNEGTMIDDGK